MHAQVYRAKGLMGRGQYTEAARELRPLAERGDAEAQYLAATLFFEGKGLPRNVDQGVKYATLSADQGNKDAMMLLVNYYERNKPELYVPTMRKYLDRHPYLEGEELGLRYAECLMEGRGVAADEEKAWTILEKSKDAETYHIKYASQYRTYKERHPELFAPLEFTNLTYDSHGDEIDMDVSIDYLVITNDYTEMQMTLTNVGTRRRPFYCEPDRTRLIYNDRAYYVYRQNAPTSNNTRKDIAPGETEVVRFFFKPIPRSTRGPMDLRTNSGFFEFYDIRFK